MNTSISNPEMEDKEALTAITASASPAESTPPSEPGWKSSLDDLTASETESHPHSAQPTDQLSFAGNGTLNYETRFEDAASRQKKVRPMQRRRFVFGLLFSCVGIGLMLMVAAGTLQGAGLNGRLSLPVVGLCMILGLMLLGGGFGVMATAAAGFDDNEFERLMNGEKNNVDDIA